MVGEEEVEPKAGNESNPRKSTQSAAQRGARK